MTPTAIADFSKELTGRTFESLSVTPESVLVTCAGKFHVCFIRTMDFTLPEGASIPPTQEQLAQATQKKGIVARTHLGDLPLELAPLYVKQTIPPQVELGEKKITLIGQHAAGGPGWAIEIDGRYLLDLTPDGFQWYDLHAQNGEGQEVQ